MQPQQQFIGDRRSQTFWRIDRSTSVVNFTVKTLLFMTITGQLKELEGSIVFDEQDISASTVNATVSATSADTGNNRRDAQLRTRSFLDADRYPRVEFQSVEVSKGTDRDMLVVKGALTIKDTTRSVVLNVTEIDRSKAPDGKEVIYYVAETELNRYDFGINAWRGLIGKSVKLAIDVQATRESEL